MSSGFTVDHSPLEKPSLLAMTIRHDARHTDEDVLALLKRFGFKGNPVADGFVNLTVDKRQEKLIEELRKIANISFCCVTPMRASTLSCLDLTRRELTHFGRPEAVIRRRAER